MRLTMPAMAEKLGGVGRFGIAEPLRKHPETLDFSEGVLDADAND